MDGSGHGSGVVAGSGDGQGILACFSQDCFTLGQCNVSSLCGCQSCGVISALFEGGLTCFDRGQYFHCLGRCHDLVFCFDGAVLQVCRKDVEVRIQGSGVIAFSGDHCIRVLCKEAFLIKGRCNAGSGDHSTVCVLRCINIYIVLVGDGVVFALYKSGHTICCVHIHFRCQLLASVGLVCDTLYFQAVILGAAHCHDVAGVVLIIKRSSAVTHNTGNAVLRMGRGVDLSCSHGLCILIHFDGCDSTRVIVISRVQIDLTVRLLISGGQKHGALRISIHSHTCHDFQSVCIQHQYVVRCRKVVFCDTDIHISVVNHRSTGTHKSIIRICLSIQVVKFSVSSKVCTVEIACLGGKVYFSVCISYGRTLVTHDLMGIQKLAGQLVAGDDMSGALASGFSVIGSVYNVVSNYHRTSPVESSLNHVSPECFLCLCSIGRIFIRYRNTHISCFSSLTVPESGVHISIRIGDRRQCLSAQRIRVDPQRFQGVGIKGLYGTICKWCEDHAVGIGSWCITPVNTFNHVAFCQDTSIRHAYLVDLLVAHDNQTVIHNDLYTRSYTPSGTQSNGPLLCCFLCSPCGLGRCDRHVGVASTEVRPLCGYG